MTDFKDSERLDLPSASTFERTVNCPGWHNLFRVIPRQEFKPETTPEAERGTRIHRARELMNPLELQDESEVLAYERWLNLEREVVRTWLESFPGQEWREGEREVRLWINNESTLEPECSARLDIHYIVGRSILICDGKTGAASASGRTKNNWQMKVTAVALMIEYDAVSVTASLIKPEAYPNGYHDTHTWNLDELRDIEKQVRFHLDIANQPDAPRRAGSQCNWCPCKPYCPEAISYALLPTVVANVGSGLSKEEIAMKVDALSVADLVFLWLRQAAIKNIQEAVNTRLKQQPESVLAEYGVYLANGRDTSSVPPESIKALAESFVLAGMPEEIVWQCLEPSLKKLSDARHALAGGTKKAAHDWVKSVMAPLLVESSSEKILKMK